MCQVQLKQTCEPREQINFEKGSLVLERGLICVWLGRFCYVVVSFAARFDNEINMNNNNNNSKGWSRSQLSEVKDEAVLGTCSWLCKYLASWLFVADNWPQNLFNMPSNSNFMPHCLCNWPTFWVWGFLQCGSGSKRWSSAELRLSKQSAKDDGVDDPLTGDSSVPHTLPCCQWQHSGSRNNFIKFTWWHPQKYMTKGLCNCAMASNMPAAYLHTSRLLAFLSLCVCACVCVAHTHTHTWLSWYSGNPFENVGNCKCSAVDHKAKAALCRSYN